MPDKSMIEAINDAAAMLLEQGHDFPFSVKMNLPARRKLTDEVERRGGWMGMDWFMFIVDYQWPDDLITVEAMSDGN